VSYGSLATDVIQIPSAFLLKTNRLKFERLMLLREDGRVQISALVKLFLSTSYLNQQQGEQEICYKHRFSLWVIKLNRSMIEQRNIPLPTPVESLGALKKPG
jgi:hypothetical protein